MDTRSAVEARRTIVDVLVARFGEAAEEVGALLETINDEGD